MGRSQRARAVEDLDGLACYRGFPKSKEQTYE